MHKQLMKGNEAIVHSAILAGCRAYYGYPITPASEIAEAAALYFPQVGGTFLQAESEVGAINMVFGAAATGVRAMSASSGPGLSRAITVPGVWFQSRRERVASAPNWASQRPTSHAGCE